MEISCYRLVELRAGSRQGIRRLYNLTSSPRNASTDSRNNVVVYSRMIVQLIDGTYELFRHLYGQRRSNVARVHGQVCGMGGAAGGQAADGVAVAAAAVEPG
jgi:hypothetical protein